MRNTLRERQGRDQILLHAIAEPRHLRGFGFAFGAPIATPIVVRAVAIVFCVRLVVLALVTHEVMQ
jgi:hypothetical protein